MWYSSKNLLLDLEFFMFQLSILNIINIVIIEDKESFYDLRNTRLAILCHEWVSKSLSCVRLSVTPWTIQSIGIFQARMLEWVAFPFSRGSSQHRDRTQVSCIASGFCTSLAISQGKLILGHTHCSASMVFSFQM